MKRDRLNIGLFVSHEIDEFDNAVIKGAMQGAKEVDANLIIVPGRYIKPEYYDKERARSDYQYNTLFSYVNSNNIDVLLVLLGTIGTMLSEREKKIFLDMYSDIPVILLASSKKGYASINFDNASGLKEGITDLIKNRKCKKIGFVSGPLTNQDAQERLKVYKDTLKKNKIEFDDSYIGYGNFSEYSDGVVEELLKNHKDLDAIVFANDSMAIGGYRVLKEKGYRIGDNIQVLGFDDSPVARTLSPKLSSVCADAGELGRVGAIEAVKYVTTGKAEKIKIKTKVVHRDSTGSSNAKITDALDKLKFASVYKTDPKAAAKLVINCFGERNVRDNALEYFDELLMKYMIHFWEIVESNDRNSEDSLYYMLENLISSEYAKNIDEQEIFDSIDLIKNISEKYIPGRAEIIAELSYNTVVDLATIRKSESQVGGDELTELLGLSNSIARDMLYYGGSDDKCFATVTTKLSRIGYSAAYLYSFEAPFVNDKEYAWHDWQIPENVLLKTYFEEKDNIIEVESCKQRMRSTEIFDNRYMPKDRRYDMFVSNLFINEEQLGLLVCEIKPSLFTHLAGINAQMGAAFKIIYMLKLQQDIQAQLERNLQRFKESNEILENMSKSDELTGVYNRRGFFEMANNMVRDPKNARKKAILIFADMDNLKQVNDIFGHDDGDFSLRGVADILKDSMRASDIVARIGGDEFAAIALAEQSTIPEVICNRIKRICKKFNDDCDKPYYVGVSVGYAEFDCEEGAEIEKYMDMADERLYEDKKNKRKDIRKEQA